MTTSSLSSILSAATSLATSTSTSTSTTASSTYTTFLTMLTTELQSQDPLNPMDTTQFTNQLVQLSSMEQLLTMNSTLTTISNDISNLTAAGGVNYIGKTVEATGSVATMTDDSASWSYSLASASSSTTLTITDSSGDTVWSGSGDTTSGSHTLDWNGQTSSGTQLTSGDYTLTVSATDSSGTAVTTSTEISGTVTGVDTSSGTTELTIGDVSVPLSSVTKVTSS